MTPDALEARLAGHPASATVTAVIHELRADPDWTVTEMMLREQIVVIELLHHPSGTAYTLSRRQGRSLQRTEGQHTTDLSRGEWVTVAEAARQLGLHPGTLRAAAARGVLAVRKLGHRSLVSAQELERYRREHLGKGAWQHRGGPDYQPSPHALAMRRYRDRKRARKQGQHTETAGG